MLFRISRYDVADILLYASSILKNSGRTNASEKKSRAIRISLAYDRFSTRACGSVSPRSIIVHDIPYLHGTNNFASRYRTPCAFNVHLCPSGIKTTASYSEMYTRTVLFRTNNNGKVCSSFDRYRVGGETIVVKVRVHVNRKIRFNTLISFCF